MDNSQIERAARSVLNNLSRTSFSADGFTSNQIDAISEAIASAIDTYDKQRNKDS